VDESRALVRVLLVSSRFPWPAFTGDRLRATIWLAALGRQADVTLIAPSGEVPPDAPRFRFEPARFSLKSAAAAALRVVAGLPFQTLLAAPYDWAGAIRRAGEFDAVIVLLSRLDPWVRAELPRAPRILDAIDSLRRNAQERAIANPLWRVEERRVAKAEADAARAYDRVVVVSEEDREELRAIAIPNGVDIQPLTNAPRVFDFGFWGRLAYFANADATSWLLEEIWPAVRALRPNATLVIAGSAAPNRVRGADGRDGIVVRSPVDDIAALAREIRVALFPVRYGSGQSNKVLEAAEAGCAIVATPRALRGLDSIAAHAVAASDANAIARAAVETLGKRDAMSRALREAVETHYPRTATLARLAALIGEVAA
jgi:glycosyltransferase involved in cell wall biosynthesis